MEILHVINELMEIIFLISGLKFLCRASSTLLRKRKEAIIDVVFVCAWMFLCLLWIDMQEVFLFCRFAIIGIYILILYRNQFLDTIIKAMVLLVCVDMLNLLVVFITYPFALLLNVDTGHITVRMLVALGHLCVYVLIILIIMKRKPIVLWNVMGSAKNGIFLICTVVEIVCVGLKTASFQPDKVGIYLLWIAFIVFGVTILILWLRDKKKQHDKMADLISYEHRTREIIPAIEKTLQDVKNMALTKEEEEKIIEELTAVCRSNLAKVKDRGRPVRSFATSGSAMLDNQLEQFIVEAFENDILMDVIIRARLTEILDDEKIEICTLMQIVGDLYRNAFRAVSKNTGNKNILFCFGYNQNGFYEIGVFDNGHPFPQQVLDNLGKRGNTVGGTGHGLADVLEHLRKNRITFVLEPNPASGTTFTKGIHIIFNDVANIQILD